MITTLSPDEIKNLVSGKLADPFTLLGAHPLMLDTGPAVVARAFLPKARRVAVLDLVPDQEVRAGLIDKRGLFEAVLPGETEIQPYRLKVDFGVGSFATFYDCYSFRPVLTDYDFYLLNQGNHYEVYDKLGAHPLKHQGVSGILFGVWAPSATRVSIVGDFNQWDGRRHQMRCRGASGVGNYSCHTWFRACYISSKSAPKTAPFS